MKYRALAVLLGLVMVLAACGGDETEETTTTTGSGSTTTGSGTTGTTGTSATTTTSAATGGTVRIGWGGAPSSLNPGLGELTEDYSIYELIYNTPITLDLDGNYVGELATDWSVSDGRAHLDDAPGGRRHLPRRHPADQRGCEVHPGAVPGLRRLVRLHVRLLRRGRGDRGPRPHHGDDHQDRADGQLRGSHGLHVHPPAAHLGGSGPRHLRQRGDDRLGLLQAGRAPAGGVRAPGRQRGVLGGQPPSSTR